MAHVRPAHVYDAQVIRVGAVTFIALACASCVSSGTAQCPDMRLCSDGTSCVRVPDGTYQCASDDQLAACKQVDEGAACTVDAAHGTCFGGGCIIAACGDGVQDVDHILEACDDGNRMAGDGCSADCTSAETCGNGVTDLAVGEECDDALPTLSGDGCTSTCLREFRLWRNVTPRSPGGRIGYAVVTDPMRSVVMIGGGIVSNDGSSTTPTAAFNDTWRWDGSTWIETDPLALPERRMNAAAAYDARRKRVVMFGGLSQGSAFTDDTFEWDGLTWTKRVVNARPLPRAAASMACTATECLMFGGTTAGGLTAETWGWNGAAWTNKQLANKPSPRSGAAMAYHAKNDAIVLYGGTDANGLRLTDIWTFAGGTWTQKGVNLTSSLNVSLAYDPVREQIVLVEDATTSVLVTPPSGLWSWSRITDQPPLITGARIAWDLASGQLLAIGQLASSTSFGMATLSGSTWSPASAKQPISASNRTPAAFDPRRSTTVVLDTANGTFEWTGRGWVFRGPPTVNARDGVMLVNHPACGVTLSFGGGAPTTMGTKSNDLYRFPDPITKAQWTPIAPSAPPSPRTRVAMTYDPVRNVVVLFGGYSGSAPVDDTWELSTADCMTWTWTRRTPSGPVPAPRFDAQLAFDPVRQVSVLFGGQSATSMNLGDTWEWNGTAWTQRTPIVSPPARFGHGMALEPRRQRIVMFGGTADADGDDTWEWDGAGMGTWTQLGPAVVPTQRRGMGFAPDITGALISINGAGGGNGIVAVERLTSELTTNLPDACRVPTLDSDHDGAMGCADPDCWNRCSPACPPGASCSVGPRCGDAICDPAEDYQWCPADCPAPPP